MSNDSFTESYLRADKIVKANPGLSAKKIRKMGMEEYARLTGREPFRPSVAPVTPAPGTVPEATATTGATGQQTEQEPAGISVRDMTPEQYAAFRKTVGMGQSSQYGVGIFDSVSSQSEAYNNAARAQAGRNAMITSNVEPAPRIDMTTRWAKENTAPVGRNDGLRLDGNW